MDDLVYALTVYDNQLSAGGYFTTAGGTMVNNISAWDGSSWSPLGSGMNLDVRVLTVFDDQLFAGGGFTGAGGTVANNIAAWDGSSWSPLGSGMNGPVYALTVRDDGLMVGGGFTAAGNKLSAFLAEWSMICCELRVGNADGQGGDQPTIGDISTLIDAKFIAGTCDGVIACLVEADINQSGGISPTCHDITISDIAALIDYLFITGPETATLPDCL